MLLLLAGLAGAEGTVVSGESEPEASLVVEPSSDPVVSSSVDLVAGTRVFFIEAMPKSTTVRRITIGDLARASECTTSPDVELSIYSFATGSDLSSGSLVAQSSASRPFGASLARVTWLVDPTPLEEDGTYAFVVKRDSGACGTAQQRNWAHNAAQVDGGERACASLQDGSGRFRLWHELEAEDAEACTTLRGLANFEPGMPTGWAEVGVEGEEALLNTTRGACASDLEAVETPWTGGILCQLTTFTDPGETTEDGWYYGLPWNGPGLDGRPRDLYLALEPDSPPVVTTEAASAVHGDSATLNGTIDAGGSPTHYRFEWGADTRYGNVLPEPDGDAGEGSSEAPISESLRGLEPSTTYHYRLVAAHGEGAPVAGSDRSFTTATPPANTAPPQLSGDAVLGERLVASPGAWSGTRPLSIRYQWQRCDAEGARCGDVSGARERRYVLEAADVGATLRVVATAENAGGEDSEPSSTSAVVTVIPPSNDTLPRAWGEAVEGETLTASPGSWSGSPTLDYAYQWRLCDAEGGECADIEGADEANYEVASEDVGSTLRVAVTASNDADDATAVSAPNAVVVVSDLRNTAAPTIEAQTTAAGDTLIADPGTWSGAGPIAYAYRWQRCDDEGEHCVNIDRETGATYVLGAADVGATLRLLVTASNEDASQTATSDPTEAIANAAPSSVDAPSVTGSAVVGGSLAAGDGTWSGARPMDLTYQWQVCDERGAGCADIEDAIYPFYVPVSGDAGDTIRVRVTATSAAGNDTAASPVTPVVLAEAALENLTLPAITGTALSGETLTADEGLWSGTGTVSYAFQWRRCTAHRLDCVDVEGATRSTYALGAP
ncbi:MAG TPA: hypothetical protein VK506_08825, partial [Conexibacter sp.]|nr:hypothetical protein [Conexibacter sp.]